MVSQICTDTLQFIIKQDYTIYSLTFYSQTCYMSCVRIASLVLLLLLEGIINCPKWLSLNNETMSQFIGPQRHAFA